MVRRKEKQETSFFGEKEKSKTTNIADILQEVKRQKHQDDDPPIMNNHGGSGNLMSKFKMENTCDISQLKKGSFHS